jgi:hypothetical protein
MGQRGTKGHVMKNNEWLTAESFEQAHELLSAINTLSIHTKLLRAGIDDTDRLGEVAEARTVLTNFLDRFEQVVSEAEQRRDHQALGVDPRFGQLVSKFLAGKSRWPQESYFYSTSFAEIRRLMMSEKKEDQQQLIAILRDLRAFVEQHAHSDVVGILGDI